jgi:hypothetical protein
MTTAVNVADLRGLDDPFRDEPIPAGGGGVPPGEYRIKLYSLNLGYSKAGDLMLSQEWHVVGGQYDGWKVFRNNMLTTNQNLGYLKKDLKTMGVNVDDARFKLSSFLDKNLNKLLDVECIATVVLQKNDPTKTNCYLKSLASADMAEEAAAAAGGDEGDFDPFAEE